MGTKIRVEHGNGNENGKRACDNGNVNGFFFISVKNFCCFVENVPCGSQNPVYSCIIGRQRTSVYCSVLLVVYLKSVVQTYRHAESVKRVFRFLTAIM